MRRITAGISALLIAASMVISGAGGVNVLAADRTEEASSEAGSAAAASGNTVKGKITVDGSLDDWTDVPEQKSNDNAITWWKAARDAAGNLYMCFTGNAVSQWDGSYQWKYITLLKADESLNNGVKLNFVNTKSQANGDIVMVNTANGNTAGAYYVELMIPAPYLENNKVVTMNFEGEELILKNIPVLNGSDITPKKDTTYHGITIDGNFDDWAGIKKYDAKCPNPEHPNCLDQAAMVFDGDYVYIYVKDGQGSTAASAGTHTNGNFAITTDLGGIMLLKFNQDGTVTSDTAQGITSRHVGAQWEVAVPASQLPKYKEKINFGLYGVDQKSPEAFVKDVSNLKGGNGNAGNFTGITYDGQYDDWNDYPHSPIEYATNGTQEKRVDAGGALYSDGETIYGHVYTEMPAHLQEYGGELANAVSIKLNNDDSKVLYLKLISVDDRGNINWNPSFVSPVSGESREYYIVDTSNCEKAPTLDQLKNGNYGPKQVYGKMTMTLNSSKRDECEFYLDPEVLADKFNMNANEIQYVSAQFGRIGQQWISTAGTSTAPFLGVGICIASVAVVLLWKKKHRPDSNKPVPSAAAPVTAPFTASISSRGAES